GTEELAPAFDERGALGVARYDALDGRRHRRDVVDERGELVFRQPLAAETLERLFQVILELVARAHPAERRRARDATREHRRLPRAVGRRPGECVLAAVGVAARACAAV